jgi:hypothetical protein
MPSKGSSFRGAIDMNKKGEKPSKEKFMFYGKISEFK